MYFITLKVATELEASPKMQSKVNIVIMQNIKAGKDEAFFLFFTILYYIAYTIFTIGLFKVVEIVA